MRSSKKHPVEALVKGTSKPSMTVVEMLDEIERLRRVLQIKHADTCSILRTGDACSCGCFRRDVDRVAEAAGLRAQLAQSQRAAVLHMAEIARLDAKLAVLICGGMPTLAPLGPRVAKGTPVTGAEIAKATRLADGLEDSGPSREPAQPEASSEHPAAVETAPVPARR